MPVRVKLLSGGKKITEITFSNHSFDANPTITFFLGSNAKYKFADDATEKTVTGSGQSITKNQPLTGYIKIE